MTAPHGTDRTNGKKPDLLHMGKHAVYWARANLFSSWGNTLLTLGALWVIYKAVSGLLRWAVFNATIGPGRPACDAVDGACWAFIREMAPLFVVGTYPYEERWRPYLVFALILAVGAVSLFRSVRQWRGFFPAWLGVGVVAFFVIRGVGLSGMLVVDTSLWGGLMLTLLLSVAGIGVSFPIGVVLALGRRSRGMPIIRALSIGYIELIRGVPLITVLFMSSVMLPLFFPPGFELDKLLRAQVGIILFSAAYVAEVVRGGLQAVPQGQEEAADALGLSYWQKMRFIVLPQSLRIVIPPLVNTFIALLKDTSLVAIIGLYDLLGISTFATANPQWLGKITEAFVFIAAIYWVICFSISRYSIRLEQRLNTGR